MILVTGATGFIGQRLVGALEQHGVSIHALTRDAAKAHALWPAGNVVIAPADLGEPETIGDACSGVHTLFHLAGHAPSGGPWLSIRRGARGSGGAGELGLGRRAHAGTHKRLVESPPAGGNTSASE